MILNVQIVLDFAYIVTHKRCKNRTLNIEKLANAVSAKGIFEVTPQNFPENLKTIMSLNFAKNILKN